jgi:hypothetical protein
MTKLKRLIREGHAIHIELVGCDDQTILNINVSDDCLAQLIEIADAMNATRTYGCMPSFDIFKLDFATQGPGERLTRKRE